MNRSLKITMPVHRGFSEGGNGRVYDPKLARFLNPDPVIANPSYTQDYNAYSYVRNNPLGYVVPSGYRYRTTEADAWALEMYDRHFWEVTMNGGGGGGGLNQYDWQNI